MTVHTYTVGPGTLTLGDTDTPFSSQVRACEVRVTENVTTTDPVPVLSGEEVPGESDATFSYVLVTDFQADLEANGTIDYSWTNAGLLVPFSYTPNTALGRSVDGELWIVPLNIGGTAKTKPNTEVTWRIEGTPDLSPAGA